MTKVAIVKPDHLGDIILASPAIRAVQNYFENVTLFVSGETKPLAKFLFPEIEIQSVDFPHLSRKESTMFSLDQFISTMNRYDMVFWLRHDSIVMGISKKITANQDIAVGDHLTHETMIQKYMLTRHIPNYSRTKLFSENTINWPSKIENIGICVSAGFPTNRWPNLYWLKLAIGLVHLDKKITLIGGPNEAFDLAFLSKCLGKRPHKKVIGGSDFRKFLDEISDVDIVVATDSGTAHICSLEKPILSIFGSSPWRRFAPFGRDNIVLTRDLACSPCLQFSSEHVNGCATRECLSNFGPEIVEDFLRLPSLSILTTKKMLLKKGTSHIF